MLHEQKITVKEIYRCQNKFTYNTEKKSCIPAPNRTNRQVFTPLNIIIQRFEEDTTNSMVVNFLPQKKIKHNMGAFQVGRKKKYPKVFKYLLHKRVSL